MKNVRGNVRGSERKDIGYVITRVPEGVLTCLATLSHLHECKSHSFHSFRSILPDRPNVSAIKENGKHAVQNVLPAPVRGHTVELLAGACPKSPSLTHYESVWTPPHF